MITPDQLSEETRLADDLDRFAAIADAAVERLAGNERVRRNLPGEGRLRIDRQLPFLCLYRAPSGADAGTRELVTSEAAYLFASGQSRYHAGLEGLCRQLIAAMQEHFGTFLLFEIWADSLDEVPGAASASYCPAFEIVTSPSDAIPSTIAALKTALEGITVEGESARVRIRSAVPVPPSGLRPLSLDGPEATSSGCCVLGIAVRPVYRHAPQGPVYPLVLQRVRWQLAGALRRAIAEFTGLETGSEGAHYDSLGPSSMVKAARIADRELSEVSESFDFLLQVTPTNADQAWEAFCDGGARQPPVLHYRPLPYHPSHLKRRLFEIEIERLEDPTLAHLFWEKQAELDRQLTALRDIGTPQFLLTSRQIFGEADDPLVQTAEAILGLDIAPPGGEERAQPECVRADSFVDRARDEIDHYYQKLNSFTASVEVCDSIAAGIMVSRDRLLVSGKLSVLPQRVEPLLHHEVGTHLLTYFNGRSQPFRQLYAGLAGYDELQEGLAILAEYLCGGLTASRLRALAGRVVAVRSLTDGDTFLETFERLHEGHGFSRRQAFVTTLRVHRAGGLTKDVIYLRGLRNLLAYLGAGHDMEPLYVGKIGLQHVPFIQELRRRGIIRAPSLLPRFWNEQRVRERLEACRGRAPHELLEISS